MSAQAASQDLPATAALQSEAQLREDLAAAFRLAVQFDWHESVGNHFSAAVSEDGSRFLLNPCWQHFSTIKPEDLLLLDANDRETMNRPGAPDPTAWGIHSALHREVPQARVLLHCHPTYATALASLKDPTMKPIDQNTARFFGRVAVDLSFGGMVDDECESQRLADMVGDACILMMGNHGITAIAATVDEAFEHLYFFERAARNLMIAYASGRELSILSDEVAAKTEASWREFNGASFKHFEYLKSQLKE